MLVAATTIGAFRGFLGETPGWPGSALDGFLVGLAILGGALVLAWLWNLARAPDLRDQEQRAELHRLSKPQIEGPEIDPRLELVEEALALTPEPGSEPPWLAKVRETMWISRSRSPDHLLKLRFRVVTTLDLPILRITCSSLVYGASGEFGRPNETRVIIPGPEEDGRSSRKVVFKLEYVPLPPDTWIRLRIQSPVPIELVSALGAKPPASPPPTTPGS